MSELRGLFKTLWKWLTDDTPELIVELFTWLVGETWLQFGLRATFVLFLVFVVRSLWARLADVGDQNPLITIGGFALLTVIAIAALGSYYAGLWREFAPAWLP